MRHFVTCVTACSLLLAACFNSTTATTQPAPEAAPATIALAVESTDRPVAADDIVITALDLGGGFYSGHFGRIAIGADGFPVLSYLYEEEGETDQDSTFSIVFAKCSDATCFAEPTTNSFAIADWGQPPSLAFGPDGLATMVFTEWPEPGTETPGEAPDVRLIVVSCLDAACSDQTVVDVATGQGASMVIPSDGLPFIVFNELDDNETVALKCGDRTCSSGNTMTILVGARYAFDTPVVLGSDGLPIISYTHNNLEDSGNGAIVAVVVCADPACSDGGTTSEVAEAPIDSMGGHLAISADGEPVALFGNERQMWLSRCVDSACSSASEAMRVGRRGPLGGRDLGVAPDGLPVIAYSQEQAEDEGGGHPLLVAKCADAECREGTLATLDVSVSGIWGVSVAFDPAGMPVIAYWSPSGGFNIAFCGDPACAAGALDLGSWDQTEIFAGETEPVGEAMAGWRKLPDPDGIFDFGPGGGVQYVVPGGPGLVAIGSTCELVDGAPDCAPTVWISTDGFVWSGPTVFDSGEIRDVASYQGTLVAVGGSCGWDDFGAECAPAVWNSTDGLNWDRVAHDEEVFTSCRSVDDDFCTMAMDFVVAADSGFIASGWTPEGTAIWTSPDGASWSRTAFDAPPPMEADTGGGWWLNTAVSGGPGIVAFGDMCVPKAYASLGVWTDPDENGQAVIIEVVQGSAADDAGLESEDVVLELNAEPVLAENLSELVRSYDPGDTVTLIVLRSAEELSIEVTLGEAEGWPCTPLIWTSTDGVEWELGPEIDLGAVGDAFISPVVSWTQGLVAVSTVCDLNYSCTDVVLTSQDGVIWQQHDLGELFAGVSVFRIFPFDSGLLALGARFDEFEGTEEQIWFTSGDAISWRPFAPDPKVFPEQAFLNDLATLNSLVVGVGVGVWVWEPPGE